MTGRFGDADVARDSGVESEILEVFFDFGENLSGEGSALVVHRGKDAEELEIGIHCLADEFHRLKELGDALKGVKFGLDREQKIIRGNHTVDGEEREGGGRVDDDVVIVGDDASDSVFEEGEFTLFRDEFNFGIGEFRSGGSEVEIFMTSRDDDTL